MFSVHRAPRSEFASLRDRQSWARSIDGLVRNAERPTGGLRPRGVRPIYQPRVVLACAPQLRDIREVLLSPATDVRTGDLRKLQTFICEGAVSPLMGNDPEAARQAARKVRSAFVPPAPARVAEPVHSIAS